MGDLTENFNRAEFACKCGCGRDTIDHRTLTIMQEVRDIVGAPVKVHSGFRCQVYNQTVGGVPASQHLVGRACDFSIVGANLPMLYETLDHKYGGEVSLGLYDTFIHLDTRTHGGRRWDLRS